MQSTRIGPLFVTFQWTNSLIYEILCIVYINSGKFLENLLGNKYINIFLKFHVKYELYIGINSFSFEYSRKTPQL